MGHVSPPKTHSPALCWLRAQASTPNADSATYRLPLLFCGNKPPFGAFHEHRRFPFLAFKLGEADGCSGQLARLCWKNC